LGDGGLFVLASRPNPSDFSYLYLLRPQALTHPARRAAADFVIGSHEFWMAATALAHGFGARDFARVAGLRVLAARPS